MLKMNTMLPLMVIGLFNNIVNAEIALNNLEEADFQSANISLVMKDSNAIGDIADVTGLLNGAFDDHLKELLTQEGLSSLDIESYEKGVEGGGVIIAVSAKVNETKTVSEMLQDNQGVNIKVLSEKK